MDGRRVAFIVANGNYPDKSIKLAAPLRDADAFRDVLITEGGFADEDVTVLLDVDRTQLLEQLGDWHRKVQGSSLALILYAGHGAEYLGQPYLMCSTWRGGQQPLDVETHGVPVHVLQQQVHGCRKALIILDACRPHVEKERKGGLTAAAARRVAMRGADGGAAQEDMARVLTALACGSCGVAIEQEDQGTFTAALMQYLFQEDRDVLSALSNAAAAVLEATSGDQMPQTYYSLLHPDFVKFSLAKAKPPVINLTYVTSWRNCLIRFTVDGKKWIDEPLSFIDEPSTAGDNASPSGNKAPPAGSKHPRKEREWTISIQAKRLSFVMHDGDGHWDNKDKWRGELNYEISSPGSYKLKEGSLKETVRHEDSANAELHELNEEQLEVEEEKEEALQEQRGFSMKPKGGFIKTLWKSDRIWVINATGVDILVCAHRFRKIKETVEKSCNVGVAPTGQVSVGFRLKALLDKDQIQLTSIRAGDTGRQLFYLGSGSGGAYVTACSKDERTTLFCKDVLVKGGWCITVQNDPLKGNEATTVAAALAEAAALAAAPAATPAAGTAPAAGGPAAVSTACSIAVASVEGSEYGAGEPSKKNSQLQPHDVMAALWPPGSKLPYLNPWSPTFYSCCFTASTLYPDLQQLQHHSKIIKQQTGGIIASGDGCHIVHSIMPPDQCYSPCQMLTWIQAWAEAAIDSQGFDSCCRVFAASSQDGMVAWCTRPGVQWGTFLGPGCPDVPSPQLLGGRILSCRPGAGTPRVQLSTQPIPPNAILQAVKGHTVYLASMPLDAASRSSVATMSPSSSQAESTATAAAPLAASLHVQTGQQQAAADAAGVSVSLPSVVFDEEGLLLVRFRTRSYCSSKDEPMLVLNVERQVTDQLNVMAAGQRGSAVVHWLYHLLLQPDMQLHSFFRSGMPDRINGSARCSPYSHSDGASTSACAASSSGTAAAAAESTDTANVEAAVDFVMQHDMARLGLAGGWSNHPSQATRDRALSPLEQEQWLQLRIASSRAMAAYNLLAVAVALQQERVVQWLLEGLTQGPGGQFVENCIVAQQRLAWSEVTGSLQVPLLVLAAATGNEGIMQTLQKWSSRSLLQDTLESFWGGVSVERLLAFAKQQKGDEELHTSAAIMFLQEAMEILLQPMPHKDLPSIWARRGWQTIACEPTMKPATSLEEVHDILGDEGDLSVAVMANREDALRALLSAKDYSQQQVADAVQLAEALGVFRLSQMLQSTMLAKVGSTTQDSDRPHGGSSSGCPRPGGSGNNSSSAAPFRAPLVYSHDRLAQAGTHSLPDVQQLQPLCNETAGQWAQLRQQVQPLPEPGANAMIWFCNHCADGVESADWSVFWHEVQKAVKQHLGSQLNACYVLHKLHKTDKRSHFQQFFLPLRLPRDSILSTDHNNQITKEQFSDVAADKSLAEVIDWVMRVKWSQWQGLAPDDVEPNWVEPASLSEHRITGWRVGVRAQQQAVFALAALSGSKLCAEVVCLLATGLVKQLGTGIPAEAEHWAVEFREATATETGTELHGQCATRRGLLPWIFNRRPRPCKLTQFMDVPTEVAELGEAWSCSASHFHAIEGEFVGYQVMRAGPCGPLASARFLFKQHDLQQPGFLDFAFISHTGVDRAAGDFAAVLHRQLVDKQIPAFFDAKSLQLGDVWRPRIIEAASNCRVCVAVVSPNYPTRKWPLLELHLALQSAARSPTGCVVMPVLFDVSREQMEEPSSTWQSAWADMFIKEKGDAKEAANAARDNLRQLLCSQTTW